MKLIKILLLELIIIFTFTSCAFRNSENTKLFACCSYAVPGMYDGDPKGHHLDILEEDNYGRILFSDERENIITETEEKVFVICQKNDKKYTYFYEDFCYLFESDTTKSLEDLKEQNDWNKPLDSTKMSRRTVKTTFDIFLVDDFDIDYNDFKDAVASNLGIDEDRITELCFLDFNQSEKGLFYLKITINNTNHKYLVITDSEYNLAFLPIENDVIYSNSTRKFKEASGWEYGC